MGKESQKSALPTLFHFARVRAAFQPHVSDNENNYIVIGGWKTALTLAKWDKLGSALF